MPRKYTRVQQYEAEIFEKKAQGITNREIGEEYGMSLRQVEALVTRRNRRARKLATDVPVKPNGRRQKGQTELEWLRMENELLRDFLHAIGRW